MSTTTAVPASTLFGSDQAAKWLQSVHPKDPPWCKGLLLKLAKSDSIPHVKIGRHFFFRIDALASWMGAGGQRYPGGWRVEVVGPSCGRSAHRTKKGVAPRSGEVPKTSSERGRRG